MTNIVTILKIGTRYIFLIFPIIINCFYLKTACIIIVETNHQGIMQQIHLTFW